MQVRGFSLIELFIVIGIVSILNLALFPKFKSLRTSAKSMSAKSTARSIAIILEQYYFLNQTYPSDVNGDVRMVLDSLVDDKLLEEIPINPFTGQMYSGADSTGKIIYTLVDSTSYALVGYGDGNRDVIFRF